MLLVPDLTKFTSNNLRFYNQLAKLVNQNESNDHIHV